MTAQARVGTMVLRQAILSLVGLLLFLGVAVFLPGGIRWIKGWIYLLVFVLQMTVASLYLWRTNPEIFIARSKIHAETKGWDKWVLVFVLFAFFVIFPTAGLDHRFGWSFVTLWVFGVVQFIFLFCMFGSFWS